MDYGGRYSFSCGQGVKEVLKALTRSQEENGSPTAGGSLEQLAIAPETPIQCTTLLRGLLRARKDLIFMMKMDRVLKLLRKKFVVTLDQELDLNLLNEDMNTSGDNPEHCKNYKK
ncbi:hypothetical protein OIU76_021851 [Salix suchowensis]|nr:hypothetical protein OIU76_021851 [Salix suchowensis]